MKTKILLFAVVATFISTLNVSAQELPVDEIASPSSSSFVDSDEPVNNPNRFGFNAGFSGVIASSYFPGVNLSLGGRWLRDGDGSLDWSVLNCNIHSTFILPGALIETAQVMTGLHYRANSFYLDANAGFGFVMGYNASVMAFDAGLALEVGAGFYLTKKFYLGAYFNFQTLIVGNIDYFGIKLGWDI